jgi:Protein of unknown function (DUF2911)
MRISILVSVLLVSTTASAQLTMPPDGDNQRSSVTQQIGPVSVRVEYSSPRVVRGKDDRRGKIWGKLVPWGLSDLGFNDCTHCPWRAGANENTVFTVDHDVKVQGQPLPAGRYGVHMIPGEHEWTVIFSKNSTSWGSFSYDAKEDALRVTTHAETAPYREWLAYEFPSREPARATLALEWEELRVPIAITVDDAPALWSQSMRRELRDMKGFYSENWRNAAEYCVTNKVALPDALAWAKKAVSGAFVGQETFRTLMTLSRAEAANNHAAEAERAMERAIAHQTASALEIHMVGRQLLTDGKKQEAMKVFAANAKRFPNQWPVHVGLLRGYAALGNQKEALSEARLALPQAPDDLNRTSLQKMIRTLEAGQGID